MEVFNPRELNKGATLLPLADLKANPVKFCFCIYLLFFFFFETGSPVGQADLELTV